MIVCTNCGNHNEDTDEFCGSCGKFLEWVGERIEQPPPPPEPVFEEAPDPVKAGFVDRVKAAVGIDEPARSVDSSVPVGVGGGSLPENDDDGAAAELEAAAAAAAEAEAARQEAEAAAEARRAAAAQAEAEARAAADAEARASADAEAARRAQEEARAEAEATRMRQQQADAEAKARDEADARRRADEEAVRQAEQARQAQLESERESSREAATAAERAAAEAEAARQAQHAREAAEAAEAARRAEEAAKAAAEAESRARAEAEAKAREEVEARKKADEEARLRAEDEARARAAAEQRAREEEEARKRAAALLARPKPAAMKPTAPVEEKPDPFVTLPAIDPAEIVAASAGSVASGTSAAQRPAAQQSAAQQPSAVKQQPRPDPKFMAAEKVIKAGDLVCGQCGEGNDPTRKFCRKCGNSLAQAVAAKKLPWWKRIFGGKKNRVSKEASERDKRKQKAKDASFKAQMAWDSVKKGLLVLMMLGVLGSFAIPTARGEIMRRARGGFGTVQDIFNPQVAAVNAVGVAATTEVPEKPAAHANDLGVNTYWAEAAEGDGVGQQLSFTFAEPTDLTKVLVMVGATDDPENYLNNPRPKELHLVFDTGGSADITLLDEYRKSQGFNLKGAKGVTRVDIVISSVYPGRGGAETGIAEVEFKKKG